MKNPKDRQVGGSHYTKYKIQPIDFITENELSFIEGCVIKYICRYQDKNGIEDLDKAIHYIELLKQTAGAKFASHIDPLSGRPFADAPQKHRKQLLRKPEHKLYVSLPISGRPLEEAKARAVALRTRIKKEVDWPRYEGMSASWFQLPYEVVTPFDCSPHSEKPYAYHMGKCIESLLECEYVCFDEGWEQSKGCRLEHQAAEIYGIKIVYLKGDTPLRDLL